MYVGVRTHITYKREAWWSGIAKDSEHGEVGEEVAGRVDVCIYVRKKLRALSKDVKMVI